MEIAQYDIVQVAPARTGQSVIEKIRPCVVVSPDEMNRHLRTIVVVPLTTRARTYPTRVQIRHQQKTVWIVVDQIITVDRTRIIKKSGKLSGSEIGRLKEVIRETYVD